MFTVQDNFRQEDFPALAKHKLSQINLDDVCSGSCVGQASLMLIRQSAREPPCPCGGDRKGSPGGGAGGGECGLMTSQFESLMLAYGLDNNADNLGTRFAEAAG